MPTFMDFHDDLKLPAETVSNITQDAKDAAYDQFGVRQLELFYNPGGQVYCLLEAPDEDADGAITRPSGCRVVMSTR
jgi:hypothetical protein